MTERFGGKSKKEAIGIAHRTCILSIITSGCSFFVATFGVSAYSKVDMIGSICTLLSRGAIISMTCVLFLLPSAFFLFDGVIMHTTLKPKDGGVKVKKLKLAVKAKQVKTAKPALEAEASQGQG